VRIKRRRYNGLRLYGHTPNRPSTANRASLRRQIDKAHTRLLNAIKYGQEIDRAAREYMAVLEEYRIFLLSATLAVAVLQKYSMSPLRSTSMPPSRRT